MKLRYCLPLTLAFASAALACNSSGSNGSPDDASVGASNDASTVTPTPDGTTTPGTDSGADDASTTTPQNDSSTTGSDDSSTTAPDSSTGTPDSSTGAPDTGTPDTGAPDTGAPDAGLSWATDIYAPLIATHCTGCHGGTGSGVTFGKLDMSTASTGYANLVNIASTGAACGPTDGATGPLRVIPGNADDSLLYQKVNGFTTAPPCGSAMPKSGEIPDGGQQILVDQIEAWIDQGANP
jgi:hypothetical protein